MAQALPDDDATAPGDAPLGEVVDRLARAESSCCSSSKISSTQ